MYEGTDDESAVSLSDNDPSGGSVSSSQASLSSDISNFVVSSLPGDSIQDDDADADSDTSFDGYEFYDENNFPSGVDDVVHVELADLCRRIKAPLFAYNEILRWLGMGESIPLVHVSTITSLSVLLSHLYVSLSFFWVCQPAYVF
jgi:hypothetical protein